MAKKLSEKIKIGLGCVLKRINHVNQVLRGLCVCFSQVPSPMREIHIPRSDPGRPNRRLNFERHYRGNTGTDNRFYKLPSIHGLILA